jgi:EAL domain-containing protein (putative c-di-GMP-specific phosphodiesterase class I)
MLYIYQYDVAALAICMIIMIMYATRRGYPTKSGAMFFTIVVVTFISSFTDFISAFTVSCARDIPVWINYLVNMLYLLSYNTIGALFYAYALMVVKGDAATGFENRLWKVIIALEALLILTNPVTHFIFYFDENYNYRHGYLFFVLYVGAFVMLVSAVRFIAQNHRKINRNQLIACAAYACAMTAAVLLQAVFQTALIGNFVCSALYMVLYISLENPADYMYKNTYCYNVRAFNLDITRRIDKNSKFSVVAVAFENIRFIIKALDKDNIDKLKLSLISILQERFGKENVFYLGAMKFAVILNANVERTQFTDFIKMQNEYIIKELNFDIALKPYYTVVQYPDFAQNAAEVSEAIEYGLHNREHGGGEDISFSSGESMEKKHREEHIMQIVRNAITEKNFQICYQPIFSEHTGNFASAEALVRLPDNEMGYISSEEFVPLAERNGMVTEIGDLVFENVCRFWNESKLQELGVKYVEVNLSMLQLMRENLSKKLIDTMNKYNIPAQCFNFEITETAAMSNESVMKKNMEELISNGSGFSLDDYGSGFSSASYLLHFPVELVKIDKGILWPAMESEEAYAILKSTMEMLRAIHKKIVVEGVETVEMRNRLRNLGCDYYQGYLFSKPISEKEYITFLKKYNLGITQEN